MMATQNFKKEIFMNGQEIWKRSNKRILKNAAK